MTHEGKPYLHYSSKVCGHYFFFLMKEIKFIQQVNIDVDVQMSPNRE